MGEPMLPKERERSATRSGGRKPWSWRAVAARLVGWLFVVILVAGASMFFEDSLIYFPSRYPQGQWSPAPRAGCVAEDVYLEASDGIRTHAWFLERSGASKVLVYFHGNAGSIADRFDWGCALTAAGVSVLMVDYRGYGRSEGRPSEAGIYRDAEAAWAWLRTKRSYQDHEILLYGKSLGGGPATELAVRQSPGALILQSTFTSIPDMAKQILPFAPRFLVRTRFDNYEKLPQVTCQVLVIHSENDEIVPFEMGKRLSERAPRLHAFEVYRGYGHNDLVTHEGASIVAAIGDLVRSDP